MWFREYSSQLYAPLYSEFKPPASCAGIGNHHLAHTHPSGMHSSNPDHLPQAWDHEDGWSGAHAGQRDEHPS